MPTPEQLSHHQETPDVEPKSIEDELREISDPEEFGKVYSEKATQLSHEDRRKILEDKHRQFHVDAAKEKFLGLSKLLQEELKKEKDANTTTEMESLNTLDQTPEKE